MKRSRAVLILVAVAIISLFFIAQLPSLRFNYVFEDFFPQDDPELDIYTAFRETFGEDNNYLLIGIQNDESIFDEEFLGNVHALTLSLDSLHETTEVQAITNLRLPVVGPAGIFNIPMLRWNQPDKYTSDSLRIVRAPHLINALVSEDFSALAISTMSKQDDELDI